VAGNIQAAVTQISPTGDLITGISAAELADAPRDERVTITCDEHETRGLWPEDHGQPPMTLIAVLPADGPLRLSLVGDSARAMLGVAVGATVQVRW